MKNGKKVNSVDGVEKELYKIVLGWSKRYKRYFKAWDYEDTVHESYIIAKEYLLPRWDPDRGSLLTFLNVRLLDIVFRRYAKTNGRKINRLNINGSKYKRVMIDKELAFGLMGEDSPIYFLKSTEFSDTSSNLDDLRDNLDYICGDEWEIAFLVGQGVSMKEISEMFGYANSSSISFHFNKIKDRAKQVFAR